MIGLCACVQANRSNLSSQNHVRGESRGKFVQTLMESVSLILSTISALPRLYATEKRKNLPIEDYECSRVPSTERGL